MPQEQMMEIAIETNDPALADKLQALLSTSNAVVSQREGLDGALLQTVVIMVGPLAIRELMKLAQAGIAARKHVRFIKDGVTIQGVSEATLLKLLERDSKKSAKR